MRRACKLPILLTCLVLTACAPAYDAARFRADFALGVKAYDARDYAKAARYWGPLADRYDLAAMRNMGNLYRLGLGVEKNPVKALAYYEAAAKRGFAPAQYAAALMHVSNDGIPYNGERAIMWLSRAAQNGFQPAQAQLQRLTMQSQPFN